MDNRDRYEHLYSTRKAFLRYPAEWLIRLHSLRLRELSGRRALDYGFGSGNNAAFLIAHGWNVDGLEVTKAAAELAQENGAAAMRVHLVPPDAARLPFEDGRFDFVLANQSLYYLETWEQIESVVGEFRRVLAPGGIVAASMMGRDNEYAANRRGRVQANLPHRLAGPAELVWALDRHEVTSLFAGFSSVEVGYYDSVIPPKGRNFHWLAIGVKSESIGNEAPPQTDEACQDR